MTSRMLLAGLGLLGAAITPSPVLADDTIYFSNVGFAAGDGAVQADVDGTAGIVGEVGKHLQINIKYQIGWFIPTPGGGPMTLKESAIKDPEYTVLWDHPNDPLTPPGLLFSTSYGAFSGTPTQAGVWHYFPSVRDKEDGESPYRGDGYWFTQYTTWDDKTWVEPQTQTPLVILAAASPKMLMLECTGTHDVRLLLQVDYESGIVRIIGNDGEVAGVYHANVTDDFIAWGKTAILKPAFSATSVKLDRKTGDFTTTDTGSGVTGTCGKRSAEQKF